MPHHNATNKTYSHTHSALKKKSVNRNTLPSQDKNELCKFMQK